jgi:FecR protein
MKKLSSNFITSLIAFLGIALMLGLGAARALRAQNERYPDQSPDQAYPNEQPQQDSQGQPPYQEQGPPPPPDGEQSHAQQQAGQPQPNVARLSFVHGDVSQQRGDNGEWVASTLNTPVEPGDRVSTGQDARAELQLDYANLLRMSNNVTANITTLTRNRIQIQVGQGLTTYSVLRGNEADSEIDTPNASVHPLGEGDFRILVNSNAETQVMVRSGAAEVSTQEGSTRVEKGQMVTVAGADQNTQYRTDPAPGKDEWDSWNNDRDKRIANSGSWSHTNRYYTGSEDLDSHGTWSEIPDYGSVWSPANVDPDWAPYRAGRWVYEPYYGWTWVSYEPWGWAPYHYGRWMVYGGSWVWWPGPVNTYRDYYPIWSPAYVSFFGFGGGGWGVNVGLGFGGWGRVGWLPCGPGDWYHPWYGGWGGRYNTVGIGEFGRFHEGFSPLGRGRFSNFDGAFRNDRVRGGFSSMAGNEFGRGAVSMHQERISEASFRQASVMTGRVPVNPSRESFRPSNREVNSSTIRNGSSGSQRFFSPSRGGFSNTPGAGFRGGNGGAAQPGWRGSNSPAGNVPNRADQGYVNGRGAQNRPDRGSYSTPSQQSTEGGARGGWNRFTPSSRGDSQPQSSARGYTSPNAQRQLDSPNTASRGGYGGSPNSYNRSPLNMGQPIVTPRGGYNESRAYSRGDTGYTRGNNGNSGAYSGPRGGNTGGGYGASRGGYTGGGEPRGNHSSPRGNSSGGYRGGDGGSRGGGNTGGHSSPRSR